MKRIIALLLLWPAISFGAEQESAELKNNQRVVEATLGIMRKTCIPSVWYNSLGQDTVKKNLDLEMDIHMPVVDIGAAHNGSKLWVDGDEFTDWLPLSLLLDKKGGDKIELITKGGTKVILTCEERFENMLSINLAKFKRKAVVHIHDETKLLEEGVIIRDEKGKLRHGPNGYNFDSIPGLQNLEDEDSSDSDSDSNGSFSDYFGSDDHDVRSTAEETGQLNISCPTDTKENKHN